MALTHAETQAFYDRFGRKQDTQSFYEDAALDVLVDNAAFEQAHHVFELGCGTGRFALRLLKDHLPSEASYLGVDLSQTMVEIARERLAPYETRARVVKSDGAIRFPLADHSVDRVIATYVLDLLAEHDIEQVLDEARRVLKPGGMLCLMSLTKGVNVASRIVCKLWNAVYRMNARLVGGCRPIRLAPLFDNPEWSITFQTVITQFGVPSEILVAVPAPMQSTEGNPT
jgi:ubiquinone/menaquinone biosynthesis C-methylase UbiE